MIEKISTNQKGGARPGAGRKKGAPNIRTRATQEAAEGSGITPLEYMLNLMRDPELEKRDRLTAAVAAAPYVHAKLSAIELSGKDGGPVEHKVTHGMDFDAKKLIDEIRGAI